MTPTEAIERIDRLLAQRRFGAIRMWLEDLGIEVPPDVTDVREILPGLTDAQVDRVRQSPRPEIARDV